MAKFERYLSFFGSQIQNDIYFNSTFDKNSPLLNKTITNDELLKEYDVFIGMKRENRISSVKSELDHYLEEDVIKRTSEFDILNW
ncbi:hypothetical protein Lal_00037610 [Lupinus albus]|nr:hypothetical protein Lal_00037610 [Lupinus albus]